MALKPIPGAPPGAPIPDFPSFDPKPRVAPPSPRAATPPPRPPPTPVEPPDPVTATAMLAGRKEGEALETRRHESGAISFCFDPGTPTKLAAPHAAVVVEAARNSAAADAGSVWLFVPSYADEVRFSSPRTSGFITTKAGAWRWADEIAPRTAEEKAADLQRGRETSGKARLDVIESKTAERKKLAGYIAQVRGKTSPLTKTQRADYDLWLSGWHRVQKELDALDREGRLPPLFPEFHEWFVVQILVKLPVTRPWATDLAAILSEHSAPNVRWRDEIEEAIRIANELPAERRRDMQMIITGLRVGVR